MSKEIRNKKTEKVKKLLKNTVMAIVGFILLYRFSLTTIPIYGALYFFYPIFEKYNIDDTFLTKVKKSFLPSKASLKLDGKRVFLSRVSIFQNRFQEGNQSHFDNKENPNLPPFFSIINTREPSCTDSCPKTLKEANNFKIYRVNFEDLNAWQKLIYCGFSVVQVLATIFSAFLLWCGCCLPRSNYSLFAFDPAIICGKDAECNDKGQVKAGSNLRRFWSWLTTLGVDREVFNYKYFLGMIDKDGKLKEELKDNDCSIPGIRIGFDKWWCRIKKIYIQFLIFYFILQIMKSGMNTQFTKILTGFGGAFALIFSIILLSYYFLFKGFGFFTFNSKDSILFPAFNINGTNFNTNEGEDKTATSMFTNRNLQDLLLEESGIKEGTLTKALTSVCNTIMEHKKKRKKLEETIKAATEKAENAMKEYSGKSKSKMAEKLKGMNMPGANMTGIPTGIPNASAPRLRNMRGGANKKKKLKFTPEKLAEFREMLMAIANMNTKQITYNLNE